MGVLDGPMASVAKALVGTFGRTATLRRWPASAYDNATGQNGAQSATPTDVSCSIVFESYADRQIDGTLIRAGDRRAIVARSEVTTPPVPDRDELIEGGRTYRIVRVEAMASGDNEAAYVLQLRR